MGRVLPRADGHPPAVVEPGGEQFELQVGKHLDQRGFDKAADPLPFAPEQERQHAMRQRRPGENVADGQAHGDGAVFRPARQPHHAGAGLGKQVLPRQIDPGAGGAVARDRAIDDARVQRADGIVAEAEPFHHPGAEVLQHDIGPADEVAQGGAVGFVLHVDLDRPLVAVDRVEDGAFAADARIGQVEVARQVARAGAFDLDHIGAEVGEFQRGIGAGEELAEIQHAQAFQRQGQGHGAKLSAKRRSRASSAVSGAVRPVRASVRMALPSSWKAM